MAAGLLIVRNNLRRYALPGEDEIDVRLLVTPPDGEWCVLDGDSGCDTDHRGYRGASVVRRDHTPADLWLVAKELIKQAYHDADDDDEPWPGADHAAATGWTEYPGHRESLE